MNKSIIILFLAAVMLTVSVSAWHCSDTDATTPVAVNNIFGTWGDNGLLNGTTIGWADSTPPIGCTGTQGNYNCVDKCDGTTLIEYYCGDRPATITTSQDCHKEAYKDCNRVINGICITKYNNICTTKTTTTSHLGETVIFRKEYQNSGKCGCDIGYSLQENQCIKDVVINPGPHGVPEFSLLTLAIAIIAATLGLVFLRKN